MFSRFHRTVVVVAVVVVVVVEVVVVVVRKACTRRHNYRVKVRRRLSCPYTQTKMSSVIDGIRQAQCLAVAVPAETCFRSGGRQRGNSGRQNGCGSSGRFMCQRRLNADSGDTCQRKPRCNRQQGKMAPSRATTYKLTFT